MWVMEKGIKGIWGVNINRIIYIYDMYYNIKYYMYPPGTTLNI
jgi:hypothetical protein